MSFESDQQRLWSDVLDKLGGKEATFFPSQAGVSPDLRVMYDESMQMQPDGDPQTWVQEKTIEYSLVDLPHVAKVGEIFTVNSKQYKVRYITQNDGFTVKAVVGE